MAAFSIENVTYNAAISIEIRSTSRMFFNKEDSSIENEDSSLENEMVCVTERLIYGRACCVLDIKCHLFVECSVENAEIMENCP